MDATRRHDRATRSAKGTGCVVVVALFCAAFAVSDMDPAFTPGFLLTAAVLSYFAWRWTLRRMLPTHEIPAEVELSRRATQSLLARKQVCDAALAAAQRSLAENDARRERLLTLRQKMLDVGLPVYKDRLEAIDRGLVTLDRQKTVDVALRDGYSRASKMLEIELETGLAADQIENDVGSVILSKLDELKLLEERQADLIRELEANAEIDKFLRQRAEGRGLRAEG